jgi:hypothetical protein
VPQDDGRRNLRAQGGECHRRRKLRARAAAEGSEDGRWLRHRRSVVAPPPPSPCPPLSQPEQGGHIVGRSGFWRRGQWRESVEAGTTEEDGATRRVHSAAPPSPSADRRRRLRASACWRRGGRHQMKGKGARGVPALVGDGGGGEGPRAQRHVVAPWRERVAQRRGCGGTGRVRWSRGTWETCVCVGAGARRRGQAGGAEQSRASKQMQFASSVGDIAVLKKCKALYMRGKG